MDFPILFLLFITCCQAPLKAINFCQTVLDIEEPLPHSFKDISKVLASAAYMRSDTETLALSDKPWNGFTSWRCSTSLYQIFRALGWDGWDPQDAGQFNSLHGINIPLPSLLLSFNLKFTSRLCLVLFSHTIFIFPPICLLRKYLKIQCFYVVRSPDVPLNC